MAQVTPCSDIQTMDPDDIVKCIRGKIETLWPRKAGQKDNKPWSFQNGTLRDGSGVVKFTLSGRDELPVNEFKGKTVVFMANHGDKHGWTGLKVKENDYADDHPKFGKLLLWVTGSAEISAGGTASDLPPGKPAAKPAQEPAPQPQDGPGDDGGSDTHPGEENPPHQPAEGQDGAATPEKPKLTRTEIQVNAIIEARKFLARQGNMAVLAAKEAIRANIQFRKDQGLPAEEAQRVAIAEEVSKHMTSTLFTTFYIAADRRGMAAAFPHGEMTKYIAKAKEQLEKEKDKEKE